MKIIQSVTIIVLVFIFTLNSMSHDYVFIESLHIPGAEFSDITYYNSEIIAVSGFCKVDSANLTDTYSFVYVSTDKGVNWNKIWEERQEISNTAILERITKLAFLGENRIVLFSNYGNVFKSSDNFTNIKITYTDELQRDFCSASSFNKSNLAWAYYSSNTLYISVDDFVTINNIQLDSIISIKNVYFIESEIIYVLGERMNSDTLELVLAQTFDAGKSWRYLWVPPATKNIKFFDKNAGIIFRFHYFIEGRPVLFVNGTIDGGENWQQIFWDAFIKTHIYTFDFVDFSFGMYCFTDNVNIINVTQNFSYFYNLLPVGLFSTYNFGYQKIILPNEQTAFATSNFWGRVFKYEPSLSDIDAKINETNYSVNSIKYIDNNTITFIDYFNEFNFNVKIYDIRGLLLIESTSKQIDISNLPDGCYFLILHNGENYFYDKFIKQN